MFTKTKSALAATLFAATSSVAMAQGYDPNMANRYPGYANPQAYEYVAGANAPARMQQAPNATFQSAPVRLQQDRNAGMSNDQSNWGPSEVGVDRADRASSPYAGGGF